MEGPWGKPEEAEQIRSAYCGQPEREGRQQSKYEEQQHVSSFEVLNGPV